MNQLRKRLNNWPTLFRLLSKIWSWGKHVAVSLQFVGARHIGTDEFENGLLRLNRDTSLGKKGDLITSPVDETIFKFVIQHGEWEPQESRFLANRVKDLEDALGDIPKIAFVDIGANSGLVSRQVINLSGSMCGFVLAEPIPNHIRAINANLEQSSYRNQINVIEAALGAVTGELEISIDNLNRGNSSFFPSAMPASGIKKLNVKTLAVEEFFQRYLSKFDKYVIKSDTQGFDSKILSLLPQVFWDKCAGAVVEVWALPEIESTPVQDLLNMWGSYSDFNWAADGSAPTNLKEIGAFWLNKSGKSRNLFLKGINSIN